MCDLNPFDYKNHEAIAYLVAANQVRSYTKSGRIDGFVTQMRWYAAMSEFRGTKYDCGALTEIGCEQQFKRGNPPCRVHWGDERWDKVEVRRK